jgi:hypothetical protein
MNNISAINVYLIVLLCLSMITEKNQVASFLVSTRVYYSPTDRSTCVMRRKLSHLALSNKLNDEVEALKAKAAKLRQEADSATQVRR